MAGAIIHIVEATTHAERRAVTDSEGRFMIVELAPGTYTLDVAHPGFQVSRISMSPVCPRRS